MSDETPLILPTELELRLLAAWRKSGMKLGKFIIFAVDEYAFGAGASLSGIVDEALVEMVERYVEEYAGVLPALAGAR